MGSCFSTPYVPTELQLLQCWQDHGWAKQEYVTVHNSRYLHAGRYQPGQMYRVDPGDQLTRHKSRMVRLMGTEAELLQCWAKWGQPGYGMSNGDSCHP